MPSWLTRLLAPLRRLVTRVKDAIRSLLKERLSLRSFLAAMGEDRGFGFWWLVVTVGLAVAIAALVAVLLLPVTGLIALIAVPIWMLVRRARGDSGGSEEEERPEPVGEPVPA